MRCPVAKLARIRAAGERGFSLVEVMVAIVILVGAAAAASPFLFRSLQATEGLGARQGAVTVASQDLNYIRSLTPTTLQSGRALADVQALNASPGLVNLSQDALPSSASDCLKSPSECDSTANSGSASAVVPLTQTQVVKNIPYTVRNFINVCYLGASSCTASSSNGPAQYRIDVDVSWPRGVGKDGSSGFNCASNRGSSTCEYVVTTLRNANIDPVFSLNPAPVVNKIISVPAVPIAGQPAVLTIYGSNFAYGVALSSVINGDTFGAATINAAGTLITDTYTPAEGTASSCTNNRSIGVVNPDGTSTTTAVSVDSAAPIISSISPQYSSTTAIAHGTITLTLTGANFCTAGATQPTVTYTLGSPYTLQNATWVSQTSVTATVFFGSAAQPNGTITVTNPDMQVSNPQAYQMNVS